MSCLFPASHAVSIHPYIHTSIHQQQQEQRRENRGTVSVCPPSNPHYRIWYPCPPGLAYQHDLSGRGEESMLCPVACRCVETREYPGVPCMSTTVHAVSPSITTAIISDGITMLCPSIPGGPSCVPAVSRIPTPGRLRSLRLFESTGSYRSFHLLYWTYKYMYKRVVFYFPSVRPIAPLSLSLTPHSGTQTPPPFFMPSSVM